MQLTVGAVSGHISEGSLKDTSVDFALHALLEALQVFPSLLRLVEEVIGGTLDSSHESSYLVRMLLNKVVVGDVEDRAEAATAELSKLINPEHFDVRLGSSSLFAPGLELDLYMSETVADGRQLLHSRQGG